MGNTLVNYSGAAAPPDSESGAILTGPAASATPPTEAPPMLAETIAKPAPGAQIVVLRSGLCVNPAWLAAQSHPQWVEMAEFASLLHVELKLDCTAIKRLLKLWNALTVLAADEIGDRAIACPCRVLSTSDKPAPAARGVVATVYSDGEVNFHVQLEGLDTTLWLFEKLDLERFKEPGNE